MGFGHSARTQTISHMSYLALRLVNGVGVSMPFPLPCLRGTCGAGNGRCEVLVAHRSCPGMNALIWCQTAALCELCGMRGPAPREGRGGRGQ